MLTKEQYLPVIIAPSWWLRTLTCYCPIILIAIARFCEKAIVIDVAVALFFCAHLPVIIGEFNHDLFIALLFPLYFLVIITCFPLFSTIIAPISHYLPIIPL